MSRLASWLAFVCVVLAAQACSKDTSTETAATAAAGSADPVKLLDAGRRKRLPLRYRIPEGKTTTSTSTFRIASLVSSDDAAVVASPPGLRIDVVSGPADVTERGVRFEVDIVNVEAMLPPGLDEKLVADLQASASILDDVGAEVEIDDRGIIVEGKFNQAAKRPDIPVRLLRTLVNARTTLTRVRLPVEPVGLGARWEVKRKIQVYGFEVTQVDTYQLVDRAGDEVMLNVTVQQMAAPQTVSFPEDGMEITVESMEAQATGQIVLDLDALESDAEAHGTSADRISFTTEEGTKELVIAERFDVQVANTTNLLPDQPVE
ncbi:MAG: hypothetical protein AAF436_13295 [Myxococcota bacterium]